MMNEIAFEQKTAALRGIESLDQEIVGRWIELIRQSQPLDLYKINPILFSEKHGLPSDATVEIFLHATRAGIFDLSWNLICPACGGIQNHNDQTLNGLNNGEIHCVVCQIDKSATMDDYVEASFTIDPQLQPILEDPFANFIIYRRFFFSSSFVLSKKFLDYVTSLIKGFITILPGKEVAFDIDLSDGKPIRVITGDTPFHCFFTIEGTTNELATTVVNVEENEITIPLKKGKNRIIFRNSTDHQTGLTIMTSDMAGIHAMAEKYPVELSPFLSGKALLNNQTFRELFKIPNLSPQLQLSIRSLTILFTDLKGSTQLYDQTGDIFAYNLIREHFKVLHRVVKKYHGAIIKTMGDAVMATFSTPFEGTSAALEMLEEIKTVSTNETPLGLKIGLHEGPALAINNEGSLDYFGQTVNISARVQALANSGEIWLTQNVFNAPSVKNALSSGEEKLVPLDADLKGVGQKTRVYRYVAPGRIRSVAAELSV